MKLYLSTSANAVVQRCKCARSYHFHLCVFSIDNEKPTQVTLPEFVLTPLITWQVGEEQLGKEHYLPTVGSY